MPLSQRSGRASARGVGRWLANSPIFIFLACLLMHLAWALAMPIATAPDEPAHVYRAVSLWQGQFLPTRQAADGEWLVHVPRSLAAVAESTACTRHRSDVPAGCAPAPSPSQSPTTVGTGAGRYLPAYYYGIGWLGLDVNGAAGFYALRVASLVVASLLLTLAIITTRDMVGGTWAALTLPLAITPQVLWLGGMVNPNAWELDAGLLVSAAGLALISNLSPESRRTLWTKFLVGAFVLLSMRRLSPLWLVLIVAGVVAVRWCLPAPRRAPLPRIASSSALLVTGALALLAAFSTWWHVTLDLAKVSGIRQPEQVEGWAAGLQAVLPDVPFWVQQTYGYFGWLDTPSPAFGVLVWLMTGTSVLVLVTLGSEHRGRVAAVLGAGIGLSLALPVVLQIATAGQFGLHLWQARYSMVFSQAIPLAAALLGACWMGRIHELNQLLRIGPFTAALLWPVLGTLTLAIAMHRYVVGGDAPWSLAGATWSPPGGPLLPIMLFGLGSLGLVMAMRDHRQPRLSPTPEAVKVMNDRDAVRTPLVELT